MGRAQSKAVASGGSATPRTRKKTAKKAFRSVAAVAAKVAADSMLFNDKDSPFQAAVEAGAERLVVVTGENASGKSLYVRVAAAMLQQEGVLPVSVSIRERTGGGTHEMGGLRRAIMFGDEQEHSTGATSVGVVQTAFGNLGAPQGSLLIVDEPEIGLSEAYARALGEYIGRQTRDIPATCLGVLVVTHSRPLAQGLLDGFGERPTHAAVAAGPAQAGLAEWLDGE